MNCTPSYGTVLLSPDKTMFAWNLGDCLFNSFAFCIILKKVNSILFTFFFTGNKFPNKSFELSLQATLDFEKFEVDPLPKLEEDLKRVALTAYARVSLSLT